eukprot:6211928-Pleurochrysis_carterae.AAC.4
MPVACEKNTLKVRKMCVSFVCQEKVLARARPSDKVGRRILRAELELRQRGVRRCDQHLGTNCCSLQGRARGPNLSSGPTCLNHVHLSLRVLTKLNLVPGPAWNYRPDGREAPIYLKYRWVRHGSRRRRGTRHTYGRFEDRGRSAGSGGHRELYLAISKNLGSRARALREFTCDASPKRETVHVSVGLR